MHEPAPLRFPESDGRTVLLAVADAAWRDAARDAFAPLRVSAVCTPDAATALALVEGGLRPDLVAADLDAFGADALALCRAVRARDRVRHTPVVLLAAELRPAAVRGALAAGADDCAARCAPEAFALLAAARFRFAALASRTAPDRLESGPLVLEQESGRAYLDGEPAGLSPVESLMLAALLRNAGRTLARGELLREMHGEGGGNVRDRTVDTTIVSLRRKLGPVGARIETIRGTGYRWRPEDAKPRGGAWRRLLRGGAGALLVALGFALHAGVAGSKSHAEFAESAESTESKSHAENAEVA
ncbi:MAG: response regulator transcription factor [Kiritimatiellae bacterium]|nr:response regulator transcription factor [Kiritimatiellia bacterium]